MVYPEAVYHVNFIVRRQRGKDGSLGFPVAQNETQKNNLHTILGWMSYYATPEKTRQADIAWWAFLGERIQEGRAWSLAHCFLCYPSSQTSAALVSIICQRVDWIALPEERYKPGERFPFLLFIAQCSLEQSCPCLPLCSFTEPELL